MANLQITIDDGPEPVGPLNAMLKELEKRDLVAAFFVLGKNVERAPKATTNITNQGHVLGNHSWDHLEPHTYNYTDQQIKDQFRRTHNKVLEVTGKSMSHWRAPRLEQIQRLENLIVKQDHLYTRSHCDMNADSKDSQGAKDADAMLKFLRKRIKELPGRQWIRLLFHVKPHTANAFGTVLDGLKADGHQLVDFSQAGLPSPPGDYQMPRMDVRYA